MRYEAIGKDRTRIPAIGLGAMGFGGFYSTDRSRDDEWVDTVRLAFDQGMTLVDTAEIYGQGHSEELVGRALAGRRKEVYVATKVSPEHLAPADLVASAEASLRRLGIEVIDLYQVHWPNPVIPLDATMRALEDLVRAGKVRHIGLSNFTLQQLRAADGYLGAERVAAAQLEYNLFDRSIEKDYLPYCQAKGIIVIAYSPLDGGQICGGPVKRARLEPVAQRAGCTPGQMALAWITSHAGVVAIPKAGARDHLLANAAAGDLVLPRADLDALDRITANDARTVSVRSIRVVPDEKGHQKIYRTVEEARANAFGFSPSPVQVAEGIRLGEFLKPVRVRPADGTGGFDYDLLEGRVRYWAWVIAFGGQRDIPVLVRQ